MKDLRKVYFNEKLDKDMNNKKIGYFHKWVTYASDEGCEEYALIEDMNGIMIETYITYIQFLK